MKPPVYLGAFLTDASRAALLAAYPAIHANVHAGHMTIRFRPSNLEVENAPIGRVVRLQVLAVYHDERGQVALVTGVVSKNDDEHVTISCAGGVSPVYSNELLKNKFDTSAVKRALCDTPLFLEAVIDVFPRTVK